MEKHMLGHFGFSYVGLIYLIMLFVPNIIWAKYKPKDYTSAGENKILSAMESVGQVAVTCVSVIFSDFNIGKLSAWSIWLAASFVLMLLYEGFWIRYFSGKRRMSDFYSSFMGVPLAGATLPVAAFLLLGIYGKNIWMLISVAILGVGHIGIHVQHKKI